MPPRNEIFRIHDILQAISRIQKYIVGMSFDDFVRDEKTTDAVIRNFSIIGEAAARLPSSFRRKSSTIPWPKLIGMSCQKGIPSASS